MSYRANATGLASWCFPLICMASIAMVAMSGCEQSSAPSESSIKTEAAPASSSDNTPAVTAKEEEPLLLLDEEPLLLIEDEPTPTASGKPVADNSRCFVCHANYLDEKIAATHAQAGIGCADCHGPSDAHIADESWGSGGNGTAPDTMFPKAKINPACLHCHPRSEIDTPQHEPVFAATEAKVCTDCHGDHRLAVRRCTWK